MVEINNLTNIAIDEVSLKKITEKVLKKEKREGEISVALVGRARIKELNKNYRKKNRVTDVLSFSEKEVSILDFPSLETKLSRLGEIAICLPEVKKNAKKFQATFEKELTRILIHGVLHLLGYDHEKDKERAENMQKKEKYYLSKLGEIGEGSGEPSGSPV